MPAPVARRTLASTFDPHANSLNVFRLVFAAAVLVSHSTAIAGVEQELELGGMTLGRWGVLGFFTVSGYLISRSGDTMHSLTDFAEARAARIFPGLIVNLLVTAFVFAPFSTRLERGSQWDPVSAVQYVFHNALLYPPGLLREGIDTTLVGVHYTGVWNGSLWTLFWEGFFYVGVAVGILVSPVTARRTLSIAVAVCLTFAALPSTFGFVDYPGVLGPALEVGVAFAAGAVAYYWRASIRISTATVLVLLVIVAASIMTQTSAIIAPLPIVILLLPLSSLTPLHAVGSRVDASYGVYIYAWPLQQLTTLALGPATPLAVLLSVQVLLTLAAGCLSGALIERPAQNWAKQRRHRRSGDKDHRAAAMTDPRSAKQAVRDARLPATTCSNGCPPAPPAIREEHSNDPDRARPLHRRSQQPPAHRR
ncbi:MULTISPECIES: acyltransferase family protein [Curtobacterium]|uniref:acyltransferase family protein n=1 Tax=Curtobacterium TaxID=2034 RepID=UPI0013866CCA|nr:acyltransferase [Curtobacterium sp. HSID17257]